jgi:hypothetical protein
MLSINTTGTTSKCPKCPHKLAVHTTTAAFVMQYKVKNDQKTNLVRSREYGMQANTPKPEYRTDDQSCVGRAGMMETMISGTPIHRTARNSDFVIECMIVPNEKS